MTDHRLRVTVCGTGAASHVLAGLISARDDVELCVYTRSPEKAQTWTETLRHHRLRTTVGDGREVHSGPLSVTFDPVRAARGCDLVIISLPAFTHYSYLATLAPHLEPGCVIAGLPGQCGFDFEVRNVLGDRLHEFTVLDFATLPWACQVKEFGRHVNISGTKQTISGAMREGSSACRVNDPMSTLQRLLGDRPRLTTAGHILGITLESMNAIVHPAIMFSRWNDWDGAILDRRPLLYEAIDERAAALIGGIGQEVIAVADRITATYPQLDLSNVIPVYDWYIKTYGHDIPDKRNLMTAIRTNAGYQSISHPMIEVRPGKYIPDFHHRFIAEDVPYGLVVTRGISDIVGVPTPAIDLVVRWCQEQLGKEYLTRHHLGGRDLDTTRCPLRYGFVTLSDILGRQSGSESAAVTARGGGVRPHRSRY